MSTTVGTTEDLLPLLTRAVPSITSYVNLDGVVQANAEGTRVLATLPSSDADAPPVPQMELFVKRIEASTYASSKSWPDLRRTLLYGRTEARFYDEFLPILRKDAAGWKIAPECHLAESNLEGLVGEEEGATDVNHAPSISLEENGLKGKGAKIIMESLGSASHFQHSPLTPIQAGKCLEALAELHAAGWEDVELLSLASKRLSPRGGSYHLSIRNPKEWNELEKSWESFVGNFGDIDVELFDRADVKSLGARIKDLAHWVSDELSPDADGEYATIVHGDYKAMNVFLPSHVQEDKADSKGGTCATGTCETKAGTKEEQAFIIDYASAGVGMAVSDVAMHVAHAVHPSDLADGGEEKLVIGYLDALDTARRQRWERQHQNGKTADAIPFKPYPREKAMRHYRLASLDYFRFVLGRFWRSATKESFAKKTASRNTTLVNRDVHAALSYVRRALGYLQEFEKEKEQIERMVEATRQ